MQEWLLFYWEVKKQQPSQTPRGSKPSDVLSSISFLIWCVHGWLFSLAVLCIDTGWFPALRLCSLVCKGNQHGAHALTGESDASWVPILQQWPQEIAKSPWLRWGHWWTNRKAGAALLNLHQGKTWQRRQSWSRAIETEIFVKQECAKGEAGLCKHAAVQESTGV